MAKPKRTMQIRFLIFIPGLIFICAGVYFLINGICTYINQFNQTDWSVTTATVINVDEYRSGHKGRSTRYNIICQYEAENNIYTGKIYRNNSSKHLGDTFEIKYNPTAPEKSTQYIEPTFGIAISGIFAFLIFGFIGFKTIRSSLLKKNQIKIFPFKNGK